MLLVDAGVTHRFRTVHTNGDGACAIHSVFGKPSSSGLFLPHARTFLASALGATAQVFQHRVTDNMLLSEFQCCLWSDLVKPKAKQHVHLDIGSHELVREAHLIWDEICKSDAAREACVDVVLREQACYAEFQRKRLEISQAFAVLCTPSLKDVFIRRLLRMLGLLEEYTNTACIVPGFPNIETKFDALLADCPEGERFRRSIVEYCGANNFHLLLERVADIIATMVEEMQDLESIDKLFDFCHLILRGV